MNGISLIQAVSHRFPAAVKASHSYRGDATVMLAREFLLEVASALKEDRAFQMLDPAGTQKAIPVFFHPTANRVVAEVVADFLTFNPFVFVRFAAALGDQ